MVPFNGESIGWECVMGSFIGCDVKAINAVPLKGMWSVVVILVM